MIKNCKVCGNEFITYPSKIKIGRGKYCGKKCAHLITDEILSKNDGGRQKGRRPWNYKGTQITSPRKGGRAYRLIHAKNHPDATSSGYVREHRLVMERVLGRRLKKAEIVHHKNGDGLDNRPENLEVLTWKEHRRIHLTDNVHKRWKQ